jgi:hypothetical protein
MARYAFFVLSNPVAGREAEYNEWYDTMHLPDVLKVPGIVAAQRFRAVQDQGNLPQRYLAYYEMEADDPLKVMEELKARAGTAVMPLSTAMDSDGVGVSLFEPITGRATAPVKVDS